jgi:CheY-like chemotaxis protein
MSRNFGGTGLGLVISKRIIELMDGNIWVESGGLGEGAKFIFTVNLYRDDQGLHRLQLYSGADKKERVSVRDIYDKFRGKKLLVVDDIDINREIIISLLRSTGLIIDTAENGKEAYDMVMADPNKYDLIFMDMKMPVMDGLEATRRIRTLTAARNRRLPIIAVTANVLQEDIESCYLAGMDDHIGEPVEVEVILEKLYEYLS